MFVRIPFPFHDVSVVIDQDDVVGRHPGEGRTETIHVHLTVDTNAQMTRYQNRQALECQNPCGTGDVECDLRVHIRSLRSRAGTRT